ncbi:LOW QUALITY PROTEIN: hypothetical protein PanWU01x14_117860 [Parasponia andersonii]|uniref:Transmembrane protein n=1 Tax=Parasponia andersonii TaxID=3476 RepID=A0A2P5CW70_PARAD|nr:LOW QUALITY PROTEIN: hypothetical protein PanWU01x14_117860 [Parasponia andersonii]
MTRPKQRILSIHCWVLLSLDSLSASIASLNTLFIPPQQRSFTPQNPKPHLNLTENSLKTRQHQKPITQMSSNQIPEPASPKNSSFNETRIGKKKKNNGRPE